MLVGKYNFRQCCDVWQWKYNSKHIWTFLLALRVSDCSYMLDSLSFPSLSVSVFAIPCYEVLFMFYFCSSMILSVYHPNNIILSFCIFLFISYNPEMKTEWETWATAVRNIKKLQNSWTGLERGKRGKISDTNFWEHNASTFHSNILKC